MRVLLVEDDPVLRKEISQYIINAGHKVTIAEDGETAVQMVELNGTDLIICDIGMPGLNGYETVSIIREELAEHWIPIIFLTKRNKLEDYLKGFEVGADDYLIKPVHEKVLTAKMNVMERFIIMQQQLSEALDSPEESQMYDEQTLVYNKTYFENLASLQWSILSRQNHSASILIITIDGLNLYEEKYGSDITSKTIQQVARALSSVTHRPGDFVGRLPDNRFVIMLPESSKMGAEKVSIRIQQSVEALQIENKTSRVLGVISASIGGVCSLDLKKYTLEQTCDAALINLQTLIADNANAYLVTEQTSNRLNNLKLI